MNSRRLEEWSRPIMPFRSHVTIALAVMIASEALTSQAEPVTRDQEAAYTQTIMDRAEKIVGKLEITDAAKAARVVDLIAGQYRSLREVHDARDARIAEAKNAPAGDPTIADAWTRVARDQANLKLVELHRRFVARLSVELSPEQVENVKDRLTYGVVQITYRRYLELLPELTAEQKQEILANLLEAREYAMDAGSSDEKHAVFGKYKGRINNYLSTAGYDLKQAEKDLATRSDAAKQDLE